MILCSRQRAASWPSSILQASGVDGDRRDDGVVPAARQMMPHPAGRGDVVSHAWCWVSNRSELFVRVIVPSLICAFFPVSDQESPVMLPAGTRQRVLLCLVSWFSAILHSIPPELDCIKWSESSNADDLSNS